MKRSESCEYLYLQGFRITRTFAESKVPVKRGTLIAVLVRDDDQGHMIGQ
jgi:hypothetical protein